MTQEAFSPDLPPAVQQAITKLCESFEIDRRYQDKFQKLCEIAQEDLNHDDLEDAAVTMATKSLPAFLTACGEKNQDRFIRCIDSITNIVEREFQSPSITTSNKLVENAIPEFLKRTGLSGECAAIALDVADEVSRAIHYKPDTEEFKDPETEARMGFFLRFAADRFATHIGLEGFELVASMRALTRLYASETDDVLSDTNQLIIGGSLIQLLPLCAKSHQKISLVDACSQISLRSLNDHQCGSAGGIANGLVFRMAKSLKLKDDQLLEMVTDDQVKNSIALLAKVFKEKEIYLNLKQDISVGDEEPQHILEHALGVAFDKKSELTTDDVATVIRQIARMIQVSGIDNYKKHALTDKFKRDLFGQ